MDNEIEICVCTQCVLNGAMSLIESVEGLKELKDSINLKNEIKINKIPKLIEEEHSKFSPVVRLKGEIIKNAKAEIIMEKIIL